MGGTNLESSDMLVSTGNDTTEATTSHIPSLVLRSKVVIVGDSGVGKSRLVEECVKSESIIGRHSTFGMKVIVKEIFIPNTSAKVELFLYIISGDSIATCVRFQDEERISLHSYFLFLYLACRALLNDTHVLTCEITSFSFLA